MKLKTQNSKLKTYTWWFATASSVTALAMRFTMRAIGVRDDIPFPGLIYSLTAPLVKPFYRFFPLGNARFDYHTIEAASLAAAGAIIALALGIYMVGLLITGSQQKDQDPPVGA